MKKNMIFPPQIWAIPLNKQSKYWICFIGYASKRHVLVNVIILNTHIKVPVSGS